MSNSTCVPNSTSGGAVLVDTATNGKRTNQPKLTSISGNNNNRLFSNKILFSSNSSQQLKQQSTPTSLPLDHYAKQTSSGSETDVSTSTENLTPEEHYVLKTGVRQEPQGEETYLDMNLANDGMSFNNTLIIHENGALNYNYISPYLYGKLANPSLFGDGAKEEIGKVENYFFSDHSMIEQTNGNDSSLKEKKDLLQPKLTPVIDNDSHYSNLKLIKFANQQATTSPAHMYLEQPEPVIKLQSANVQNSQTESVSVSAVSQQQPMLANYLNSLNSKNDSIGLGKSFQSANVSLLAPTEYQKQWPDSSTISANGCKSYERLAISRSHPDLSKFSDEDAHTFTNRANGANLIQSDLCGYGPNTAFYRNNTIEMLINENTSLRTQLETLLRKVKKLQSFELEIQKVHQSHEELMRSSEKKEKLEKTLRCRLENQLRRLEEENRCLKKQVEANANKQTVNFEHDDFDSMELKKEITKRDALISRLVAQTKEYYNDKERQEIELQAQRLTLQEQRNHIEILDTALMNAQNNIITLETELRKKHECEEKNLFLKKALSNLQLSNDRRLQMEKRVRAQLEKEIEELRKHNSSQVSCTNSDYIKLNEKDIESMKRLIREYGEKIINLEAEVSKWEQKYLEENTLRSIEVSAAAAPKDAKIAALERTSQESEKLIAEARSERLKHMDEIHLANKKFTELESKLKDVESKLAEKDAMIKVLQKHSEDRDAALQKTLVRRFPTRHARSASTMGLVVSNSVANTKSSGQGHPVNTTPTGTKTDQLPSEFASKLLVSNPTTRPSCSMSINTDYANGNIDQQLRDIDSRLSPKDSIIKALRNEKERYPNHYNNWRL